MPLIDSPMLRVLSGSLDVNAFRQKLISSNMANIDTPGYRTRDIDFHQSLASAVGEADEGGVPLAPVARRIPGLIERPDGNNVSADRESLLLATTQLRFTLSEQLLKDEFHKILSAIREGA